MINHFIFCLSQKNKVRLSFDTFPKHCCITTICLRIIGIPLNSKYCNILNFYHLAQNLFCQRCTCLMEVCIIPVTNPGRFAPKPFPPLVVSPQRRFPPGRSPPSRFAPLVVSPTSRFAPIILKKDYSRGLTNIIAYKQCTCLYKLLHENLNLNSLLVKRQIDNPSPGAVTGRN